jgi:hypothetical protein
MKPFMLNSSISEILSMEVLTYLITKFINPYDLVVLRYTCKVFYNILELKSNILTLCNRWKIYKYNVVTENVSGIERLEVIESFTTFVDRYIGKYDPNNSIFHTNEIMRFAAKKDDVYMFQNCNKFNKYWCFRNIEILCYYNSKKILNYLANNLDGTNNEKLKEFTDINLSVSEFNYKESIEGYGVCFIMYATYNNLITSEKIKIMSRCDDV